MLDHTTGIRCTQAFDRAEKALSALEDLGAGARPDVVLLDVNLPGMDGIEAIPSIKARLPEASIVMITIQDDEETIFGAFRQGASGYLLKSAPVEKILAAVREAHSGGMLMPAPVAKQVLRLLSRPASSRGSYGLTDREREVLRKVVEGCTRKEIAVELFISTSTVSTHLQHIYEKLHVSSNSAAVAKAVRERLV